MVLLCYCVVVVSFCLCLLRCVCDVGCCVVCVLVWFDWRCCCCCVVCCCFVLWCLFGFVLVCVVVVGVVWLFCCGMRGLWFVVEFEFVLFVVVLLFVVICVGLCCCVASVFVCGLMVCCVLFCFSWFVSLFCCWFRFGLVRCC